MSEQTSTSFQHETVDKLSVPRVDEISVTSAPLKSAAFFLGAYCKEYNGMLLLRTFWLIFSDRHSEDFMLCKAESRDPAHCLKEGRKVTRCAIDLYVSRTIFLKNSIPITFVIRLTKMREHCSKQWDAHWECLERRNQELYQCRPAERQLNECMFEKLVCGRISLSVQLRT